jgi:hypothetical protein
MTTNRAEYTLAELQSLYDEASAALEAREAEIASLRERLSQAVLIQSALDFRFNSPKIGQDHLLFALLGAKSKLFDETLGYCIPVSEIKDIVKDYFIDPLH